MNKFDTACDVGSAPRALEGVHQRIVQNNNRLRLLDENLENTADRILGCPPKAVGSLSGVEPSGGGTLQMIHEALSVLERIVDRVQENTNRLEGV